MADHALITQVYIRADLMQTACNTWQLYHFFGHSIYTTIALKGKMNAKLSVIKRVEDTLAEKQVN